MNEIMKPMFEAFNLPTDGLTKTEALDESGDSRLWREGWSMVGVMTAQVPVGYGREKGTELLTYGVWRLTAQDAVVKLGEEVQKETARAGAAEVANYELKRTIETLKKQVEDAIAAKGEIQKRLWDAEKVITSFEENNKPAQDSTAGKPA